MSKEKECKCCHEWWYSSDIKQGLCPNCYYYFKQLKQQLEEYKNKENTSAVNSWDEMLKNCENCGLNECISCEYTQTCVQNIKQQLVKKDKEIEKLKQQYTILENENGKLTTELIMDKYKKAKKEVSFGKQLAVSELEKVRDYAWFNYEKFRNYLNQQIKELKGEKDVED